MMNRPRLLSCLALVVALALLLVTPRTPAPRVPTFAEESAALRLEVARVRVQLRHAEARMAALRRKLRSSPTSRRTRLPGVRESARGAPR